MSRLLYVSRPTPDSDWLGCQVDTAQRRPGEMVSASGMAPRLCRACSLVVSRLSKPVSRGGARAGTGSLPRGQLAAGAGGRVVVPRAAPAARPAPPFGGHLHEGPGSSAAGEAGPAAVGEDGPLRAGGSGQRRDAWSGYPRVAPGAGEGPQLCSPDLGRFLVRLLST